MYLFHQFYGLIYKIISYGLGVHWALETVKSLSSNIQSGAFRLENGNTFITDCENSRMTEVNYQGDIVFEYSSPNFNTLINRSKKYPSYYLCHISILAKMLNYKKIKAFLIKNAEK